MKSEIDIYAIRWRLLDAWKQFAEDRGFSFAGNCATADQTHYMAMGAMAFADQMLELDRPPNLLNLIEALERENKARPTAPEVRSR